MDRPSDPKQSLLYGFLAVAMWSTVATAFKLSLASADPSQLVAGATLASTLVLAAVLSLRRELGPALARLPGQLTIALVRGLINPILYYWVLFAAYERLPAQVALCINYTWPIALAGFAAFTTGRAPGLREVALLSLGYGGVIVMALAGPGVGGAPAWDGWGLALAALSSLLWAWYWMTSKNDRRPPVEALFQNFLVVSPVALVFLLLRGPSIPAQGLPPALLGMAYIGTFEMGLSFVVWQAALRRSNNVSRTSTLMFLCPLISLGWIHLVLGEALMPQTFVGLAMVSLAVGFHRERDGRNTKAARDAAARD